MHHVTHTNSCDSTHMRHVTHMQAIEARTQTRRESMDEKAAREAALMALESLRT